MSSKRKKAKLNSREDQLRDELDAVRRRKDKILDEKKVAQATIESMENEIKSIQNEIKTLRKKVRSLDSAAEKAQCESDVLQHSLSIITSATPVTEITTYPRCSTRGYLSLLGQDLQGNDSVTWMKLELRHTAGDSMTSMRPLLQYIESSSKLRHVELWTDPGSTTATEVSIKLSNIFMNSVKLNTNIETLVCKLYPSADVFCNIVPTCSNFTFQVKRFATTYEYEKPRNRIVSHLLTLMKDATEVVLVDRPREDLEFEWKRGARVCTLKWKLSEETVSNFMTSLQSMARLETLEVCGISFAKNSWSRLFSYLGQMPLLHDFSLIDCTLDGTATGEFTKFLYSCLSLRNLSVENRMGFSQFFSQVNGMVGSIGQRMAAILRDLPSNSGLQMLSITTPGETGAFLESFVSFCGSIPLSKLQLKRMTREDHRAVEKYLPLLTSIRELNVQIANPTDDLVRAFQKNESLHQVQFRGDTDEIRVEATKLRRIRAYCGRNQHLAPLLADAATSASGKILYPLLLQCAKLIDPSGLSKIVSSLKFCGNGIGPCATA